MVQEFLNEGMYPVIIIAVIGFAAIIIYKRFRKVPETPDYIEIYKDMAIEDERFNLEDEYDGLKWVYRGGQRIGKIISFSENEVETVKTPETVNVMKWDKQPRQTETVYTIVMRSPLWKGKRLYMGSKHIIRITNNDVFKIEDRAIVFPSNTPFTGFAKYHMTKNTYPTTSRSVLDDHNRRAMELMATVWSASAAKVSSFDASHALILEQKKMEIEAIKEQKKIKMGGIV